MAALLVRTSRFRTDAQARYDDTALLLDAVLGHGYDSPTGRAALSAVNRTHARYAIDDEDMLYVLAGFVVVPARWIGGRRARGAVRSRRRRPAPAGATGAGYGRTSRSVSPAGRRAVEERLARAGRTG